MLPRLHSRPSGDLVLTALPPFFHGTWLGAGVVRLHSVLEQSGLAARVVRARRDLGDVPAPIRQAALEAMALDVPPATRQAQTRRLAERHPGSFEDILDQLLAGPERLFAFSVWRPNVDVTLEVCRQLKLRRPEAAVVLGGPEATEHGEALRLDAASTRSSAGMQHHPAEATLALGTIRDLFLLERALAGQEAAAVRAERQVRSKPLVDGFFAWVKALSPRIRPKSLLGKAVGYAINQEASLRVFLEHGELPLHNNLSELLLRQGVVGRKNWLFARSEGGAKAAATLYTLVGSCQLQGIDPHAYLVEVLTRLPDHPINRVSELTPLNWRLARQDHTAAAG